MPTPTISARPRPSVRRSLTVLALGSAWLLLPHCGTYSGESTGAAGAPEAGRGGADNVGGRTGSAGSAKGGAGGATSTAGDTATGGTPSGGKAGGATGGNDATSGEGGVGGQSTAGGPRNVIFVLTDDLSWDLVDYMPHVKKMQQEGVTLSRYFVTDSLCCPSRSSILTGKFPHNTGVFTNDAPDGGYDAFLKGENQRSTFATALEAVGYRTGMMGKYMNLYKVDMPPDPGWTFWAVADNGYSEYSYWLRINDSQKFYGKSDADYGVDVLSRLGQQFVTDAGSNPFILEVAPFAPHRPFTPARRHLEAFPELAPDPEHPAKPPAAFPRTPAWAARPGPDAPAWEQALPALTPDEKFSEFTKFRKRAQAVQAVDDMIGALREELKKKGLDQNTYVIFSSDNGFHLGEHSMDGGKQTAYDMDIRVPLVVVGPDVPAGVTVDELAQNIDLCPTFIDIAGLPADGARDGRSLLPLFHGEQVADWRDFILVEHRNAEFNPNDPDEEGRANPPSYEAIATGEETYIEYFTGEREYFNHANDPYELTNAYPGLAAAKRKKFHDALVAAKSCQGAASCWTAQHFAP